MTRLVHRGQGRVGSDELAPAASDGRHELALLPEAEFWRPEGSDFSVRGELARELGGKNPDFERVMVLFSFLTAGSATSVSSMTTMTESFGIIAALVLTVIVAETYEVDADVCSISVDGDSGREAQRFCDVQLTFGVVCIGCCCLEILLSFVIFSQISYIPLNQTAYVITSNWFLFSTLPFLVYILAIATLAVAIVLRVTIQWASIRAASADVQGLSPFQSAPAGTCAVLTVVVGAVALAVLQKVYAVRMDSIRGPFVDALKREGSVGAARIAQGQLDERDVRADAHVDSPLAGGTS